MVDERELVNRITRGGDERAFPQLVQQYERLVYHVVHRLVSQPADAEDICQEVFLKVHKGLRGFDFAAKLSTWIARIAYRTAIDYLRKYRQQPVVDGLTDLDQFYFTQETPEQITAERDVSAYVNQLMTQLPQPYRTILSLYHLDEFSYAEIEQITGLPAGTVKSYLFRARKLLKEKLDDYLKQDR